MEDAEMLQQRVRLFIMKHFLEHAAPPVVEQLMHEFSVSCDAAAGVLDLDHRAVRCGGPDPPGLHLIKEKTAGPR